MLKILGFGFLALLVLAILAVAVGKNGKKIKSKNEYRYKKRDLLTPKEQEMYWNLINALHGYLVFTQVELSRCIEAEGSSLLTIRGKSLDFLICNKALEIVAGIEIDDKSHSRADRKKADATKNQAMEAAGIKLIRWPATPLPSIQKIQEAFPAITEPVADAPAVESTQDKKIKILERQLFRMARKLEAANG